MELRNFFLLSRQYANNNWLVIAYAQKMLKLIKAVVLFNFIRPIEAYA